MISIYKRFGFWMGLSAGLITLHVMVSPEITKNLLGDSGQQACAQFGTSQTCETHNECVWEEIWYCVDKKGNEVNSATTESVCKANSKQRWVPEGVCRSGETNDGLTEQDIRKEGWESNEDAKLGETSEMPSTSGNRKNITSSSDDNAEEILGTINGTLHDETGMNALADNVTVQVRDGSIVLAEGQTDETGQFTLENVPIIQGSTILLSLEGTEIQAHTFVRVKDSTLSGIPLYANTVLLWGAEELFTVSELLQSGASSTTLHDTVSFVSMNEETVVLHPTTKLMVPDGVILELDLPLITGSMSVAGTVLHGEHALTVRGDYRQSGLFQGGEGTMMFEEYITTGTEFSQQGSFTLTDGVFQGGGGVMIVNYDLAGIFSLQGGSFRAPTELRIASDWEQSGGSFEHNQNTVVFTGTEHTIDVSDYEVFYNLSIMMKNGSSFIIEEDDVITVLGELILGDGDVDNGNLVPLGTIVHREDFDGGTARMILGEELSGDIQLAGGASLPGLDIYASHVKIIGPQDADGTTHVEGSVDLRAGKIVGSAGSVIFNEPVFQYGGEIRSGEGALTFEEPFELNGGHVMVIPSGTVLFGSSAEVHDGDVTVQGGSLIANGAFTISNGTLNIDSGTIEFNSLFTIEDGTVSMGDAQLTANSFFTQEGGTFNGGIGTVELQNTLTLDGGQFTAPTGLLKLGGGISQTDGVLRHNGGTTRFIGVTQSIATDQLTLHNVEVQKRDGQSLNMEGKTLIVEGNITFSDGSIEGGDVELHGDLIVEAEHDGGTTHVAFVGDDFQHIALEQPDILTEDITIRKEEGATLMASDIALRSRDQRLTVEEGIFSLAGHDCTLDALRNVKLTIEDGGVLHLVGTETLGEPELQMGSTVHYQLQEGRITLHDYPYHHVRVQGTDGTQFFIPENGLIIAGDLEIWGGSLVADDEQEITVAGSWINTGGEFAPGQSTVVLNGNLQYIMGNNTFYNIEKSVSGTLEQVTLVVEADSKQVVLGNLTLLGNQCNFLALRSTVQNQQWEIDVRGVESVFQSLDIRDVENVGGSLLLCEQECLDRGNNLNWTIAIQECTRPLTDCGDGRREGAEECDDGNTSIPSNPDGCSGMCKVEEGYVCEGTVPSVCAVECGDNLIIGDESCDDGNTDENDGCSSECTQEIGYECVGEPSTCSVVCGDGIIIANEECDDGNHAPNDGCDVYCSVERGFSCTNTPSACVSVCGDGIIAAEEICDDGDEDSGDGCSQECFVEEGYVCLREGADCTVLCGDGLTLFPEECDDGNNTAHDGCSPECTLEVGYVCTGEPRTCSYLCGEPVESLQDCPDGYLIYKAQLRREMPTQSQREHVDGDAVMRLNDDYTLEYNVVLYGRKGERVGISGPNTPVLIEFEGEGSLWSGRTRSLYQQELDLLQGGELTLIVELAGGGQEFVTGVIMHSYGGEGDDDDNDDIETPIVRGCGNGTVEDNEECDDGNKSNTDHCLNICRNAWCGDGFVLYGFEQCEPPGMIVPDPVLRNRTGRCDESCQFIPETSGRSSAAGGGVSDGGNRGRGQGSQSSTHAISGNIPIVGSGVQLGSNASASGSSPASATTVAPTQTLCGNAVLDQGEQCDHGDMNGLGSCTVECTMLTCGDSIVSEHLGEECDDGNTNDTDECANDCILRYPDEQQGAPSAPTLTIHGGVPVSGESTSMQCGNGILEPGEQCDDGNERSGDGCSEQCLLDFSYRPPLITEQCGNGILEPGEQCDDGNIRSGDGCSAQCGIERGQVLTEPLRTSGCGDGYLRSGEQCDDGNVRDGDGCSRTCKLELASVRLQNARPILYQPVCGNGIYDAGEGCDDGNLIDGDGCSHTCIPERSFVLQVPTVPPELAQPALIQETVIVPMKICGDGLLQKSEACDAGNLNSNTIPDRCRQDCTLPECGDGVLDSFDECDDGNTRSGDGCSASCRKEETVPMCGDGVMEGGEQCDDGNTASGDGCSNHCRIELELHPIQKVEDAVVEKVEMPEPTIMRIRFREPLDPQDAINIKNYSIHGSPEVPIEYIRMIDEYTVEILLREPLYREHEYTLSVGVETDVGEEVSELTLFTISESMEATVTHRVAVEEAPVVEEVSVEQGGGHEAALAGEQRAEKQDESFFISPIPITSEGEPVGDTGPGALAMIAIGVAAGFGWMRRRKNLRSA